MIFGIELTSDDLARITSAVGVALCVMTETATCERDLNEAVELMELHKKLTKCMAVSAKMMHDKKRKKRK